MRAGDEIVVGIRFRLEKDWHTYWENPGDAGEGASIKWMLPDGLSASDVLWPGPERIPVEPLMTFGYNDEVVLLTKLIADEDLQFPAKLEAKVDWFTCKDICIPQEGSVDIEIKEGQSLPSIYSDEIKFYLDKVPTEFSHNYVVQRLDDKFFIQTDIKEGLNFQNVYFYPKEYGLTNYVEDQVYEKNQNSFVLELSLIHI